MTLRSIRWIAAACSMFIFASCDHGDSHEEAPPPIVEPAPPVDPRPRVLISTDIGGGDEDDAQSLIHALLYADEVRLEGLIASRGAGRGYGRTERIIQTIRSYEKDYPNLVAHSDKYPTPGYLMSIVRQGRKDVQPAEGYSVPTAGSDFIIQAASKQGDSPLLVLVWGSSTDVAQAIHDAPFIKPNIRLYTIGAHQDDPNARNYIRNNHKDLVWIEAKESFRGMYLTGLNSRDRYGNVGFVSQVMRPAGNLGGLFVTVSKSINVNDNGIKMGDTPSFLFAINGDFNDPSKPSWGGQFCLKDNSFWTDCADPSLKIGRYHGAKTVARHRLEYLKDFERKVRNVYPK